MERLSQVSHNAKNRREKKTTEPPPCVIYPKEGKETLEVNLEKTWSRDQREWDRESVMRREGISTPTHL
ncbi:hypothetical protein, partial [Acinetobacter baumannii]|uniref:hypothetical protein n=1 Tax=Acinetobacter baumannii TaxID=470 RepID=UPI0028101DAA